MKRFIFFAAIAAIATVVCSCKKAFELNNPSLNAGYGISDVGLAKAAAPKDTTTKKPQTPVDTTSSRSAQPDTTILPPVAPKDALLPSYYGEPVEMGISLVPADTTGKVNPHATSGTQREFKALTVCSKEYGFAVVFDKEQTFPTMEQILSATIVKGDFAGYNSAYDPKENGVWLPAIATDESFGIEYTANNKKVRSVLNKTLDKWGWTNKDKDGNYSTVVDGYSYAVENGKMTIRFGNESLILY